MSETKGAQLIVIGGTLCCTANANGLLEPNAARLEEFFTEIKYNTETKRNPFTIDSIDFDIEDHYKKLRTEAINSLRDGNTPVICGGTDTEIWYSTMLTKDLKRMGFLKPGSGQKVVFLSSMLSLEDEGGTEHVKKILRSGKLVADDPNLSGGFAVCAMNEEASRFAIHDVLNQFEKISSSLTYAFRSKEPAGYVEGDHIRYSKDYRAPPEPEKFFNPEALVSNEPKDVETAEAQHYSRIAPPLLLGSDSKMMLSYMKLFGEAQPPFHGIVIEGLPSKKSSRSSSLEGKLDLHDQVRMQLKVQFLTSHGVRVVFCNPVRYKNNPDDLDNGEMKPLYDKQAWSSGTISKFAENLQNAGAEFVTAMPKDVYLDMTLHEPSTVTTQNPDPAKDIGDSLEEFSQIQPTQKGAKDKVKAAASSSEEENEEDKKPTKTFEEFTLKTMGIRYAPSINIMKQAIDLVAPNVKSLGFVALPHNVLPNAILPELERHHRPKISKDIINDKVLGAATAQALEEERLRMHRESRGVKQQRGTLYGVTFEYAGNVYKVKRTPTKGDPRSEYEVVEGHEPSPYEAGSETKALLEPYDAPDIVYAAKNDQVHKKPPRAQLPNRGMRAPLDDYVQRER